MVYAVQLLETKLSTLLSGSPAFTTLIKNLGGGDATVNAGFLSAIFFFLPLFLMAFAVTQVNGQTMLTIGNNQVPLTSITGVSETPAHIGVAPELGADNADVLGELGYSAAQIGELRERKII